MPASSIWRTAIPVLALLLCIGVNSRELIPPAKHRLRAPSLRTGSPPYDRVYGTATHNSYWVERETLSEKLAHGTQERILDQLLHDRVRALELDVHFDATHPGHFAVYHTDAPGNSLCTPLENCLRQLQLFQYLEPQHDVVNVIIELKELWTHTLAPGHDIAELDGTLRQFLGDALYTPRDFLARCRPGATLRDCARERGWPSLDELRGKFIVNVLGNFNYNANDWVAYAQDVAARAAFPMRSILRDSGDGATGLVDEGIHDAFDARELATARAASIFWQVERLDYPELDDFLAQHGIVRARSSQSRDEQLERIRRGFQLIQCDHPGHVIEAPPPPSPLPVDPARRLRDFGAVDGEPWFAAATLIETGARLYARGDGEGLMTALARVDGAAAAWETTPSTTRPPSASRTRVSLWPPRLSVDDFASPARPRGRGCLRAASDDGRAWFMVCREVVAGEYARVSLRWKHGSDAGESVRALDRDGAGGGDVIGLRVAVENGRTCARGVTAAAMEGAAPSWRALGGECFAEALPMQGVAATRDVEFVATRRDGALVDAAALNARAGGVLVDLSR